MLKNTDSCGAFTLTTTTLTDSIYDLSYNKSKATDLLWTTSDSLCD